MHLSAAYQSSLMDAMSSAASAMSSRGRSRPGQGPGPLVQLKRALAAPPALQPVRLGGAASGRRSDAGHGPFIFNPYEAKRQGAIVAAAADAAQPEWVRHCSRCIELLWEVVIYALSIVVSSKHCKHYGRQLQCLLLYGCHGVRLRSMMISSVMIQYLQIKKLPAVGCCYPPLLTGCWHIWSAFPCLPCMSCRCLVMSVVRRCCCVTHAQWPSNSTKCLLTSSSQTTATASQHHITPRPPVYSILCTTMAVAAVACLLSLHMCHILFLLVLALSGRYCQ